MLIFHLLTLIFLVSSSASGDDDVSGDVMHHSPTQVLKNFNEIKFLKIELPSGELGIDDDVLLRWRADFGSNLDNCVMLGASSVIYPNSNNYDKMMLDNNVVNTGNGNGSGNDDNGSIPESFYTNCGLKLRVVWTISSLIAASTRHYLLQSIICEHKTLDSLVLTDADGQGVLCMNREQIMKELDKNICTLAAVLEDGKSLAEEDAALLHCASREMKVLLSRFDSSRHKLDPSVVMNSMGVALEWLQIYRPKIDNILKRYAMSQESKAVQMVVSESSSTTQVEETGDEKKNDEGTGDASLVEPMLENQTSGGNTREANNQNNNGDDNKGNNRKGQQQRERQRKEE